MAAVAAGGRRLADGLVTWVVAAGLTLVAFEAVGETTGHSVGWVAGAWGLVVMVGAVVGHALDVAEPLDADD